MGRNVTIMRLASGELIIHSTAPFTPEDVAAIRALGQPGWLAWRPTLFHYIRETGSERRSVIPYLHPEGFAKSTGLETYTLDEILPPAWGQEIAVLKLEGIPKLKEHVVLHRPSRTLIVADLVFNWGPTDSCWENFVRRRMMGITKFPAMSRLFRLSIRGSVRISAIAGKNVVLGF